MVENAICQLSHLALGWVMIRWYDYVLAILAADIMTGFIFSGSIFGGFAAYFVYGAWLDFYCQWRLKQEYGK